MNRFDVSAVINAHAEGPLLGASMASALLARKKAEENGISVELIVVLDRADQNTKAIALAFVEKHSACRLIEVDNGDLGLSRNDGALASEGHYVAFLDGDDLWGNDWLSATHTLAKAAVQETIWHPEVNVYFGGTEYIFLHLDSDDPRFDLAGLAYTNYWTALSFVRREFLLRTPYTRTELSRQLGYEDWSWHLRTLELGVLHKIVPGTGHAIRAKPAGSSLLSATAVAGCMPSPTRVFLQSLNDGNKGVRSGKLRIVSTPALDHFPTD